MAQYRCEISPLSRRAGRSVVAAEAYRSASRLTDERTGAVHDYTRRAGVERSASRVLVPEGAGWARDRGALWNRAEAAEKRKDARVGREWLLSLPHELSPAERAELAHGFARDLVQRYGVAASVSVHAPSPRGDARNHHVHILTTTRRVEPDGLGAKAEIELSDTDRRKRGLGAGAAEIDAMRERWAARCNEALARAERRERVDHRSYERQGVSRSPGVHLGPAATAIDRKAARRRLRVLPEDADLVERHRAGRASWQPTSRRGVAAQAHQRAGTQILQARLEAEGARIDLRMLHGQAIDERQRRVGQAKARAEEVTVDPVVAAQRRTELRQARAELTVAKIERAIDAQQERRDAQARAAPAGPPATSQGSELAKRLRAVWEAGMRQIAARAAELGRRLGVVMTWLAQQHAQRRTAGRRIDLRVPYEDREAAKGCGVRWDARRKTWFAPAGTRLVPLARWMPPPHPAASRIDLRVPYDSREAAKQAGARWDKEHRTWFAPPGADLDRLKPWLGQPGHGGAGEGEQAPPPPAAPRHPHPVPETPREADQRRWRAMSEEALCAELERLTPAAPMAEAARLPWVIGARQAEAVAAQAAREAGEARLSWAHAGQDAEEEQARRLASPGVFDRAALLLHRTGLLRDRTLATLEAERGAAKWREKETAKAEAKHRDAARAAAQRAEAAIRVALPDIEARQRPARERCAVLGEVLDEKVRAREQARRIDRLADELVEGFQASARGRACRAFGYSDDGDDWRALGPGQRARIERFNGLAKPRQEEELAAMRQHLRGELRRDPQAMQRYQEEKQQSRGRRR